MVDVRPKIRSTRTGSLNDALVQWWSSVQNVAVLLMLCSDAVKNSLVQKRAEEDTK